MLPFDGALSEGNLPLSGARDRSGRRSRTPMAESGRERTPWSDRDSAAEMPRLPGGVDSGMHRDRAPHHGGRQHQAFSGDCLCVIGLLAGPPRHRAIPFGPGPAFQCVAPATPVLSPALLRIATQGMQRHKDDVRKDQ
jgi:hypothetical protein